MNLATKISLDFMAQTGPGWWELRCEDHIQSQAQGLPGQLAKIRSQKSLERVLEGVSQGYSACLECMRVQSLVMKNNSTVSYERCCKQTGVLRNGGNMFGATVTLKPFLSTFGNIP